MKLPLLLSVPHAGLATPPAVADLNSLTQDEIAEDGDVGASEIYTLDADVDVLVRTDVARAFVDMNRAEDDFRKDGVVKTHTCWDVPIYRRPLAPEEVRDLLDSYWAPYHQALTAAGDEGLVLGVDCHTMASEGPPVGPDPGSERPAACLSNAEGTCPRPWVEALAALLQETLGHEVRINDPFKGGFICRSHSSEMPWVQLELSRAPYATNAEKRAAVLESLKRWCAEFA